MAHVRYRSTPQFSSNKLAEYADTASASRRERLVTEQAFQRTVLTARYRVAKTEVIRGLLGGQLDPEWLRAAEGRIRAIVNGKQWNSSDVALSLLAVRVAHQSSHLFRLRAGTWVLPRRKAGDLLLDGLRVTVRPDLVWVDGTSGRVMGAIKLVFSKSRAVPESEGAYGAVLIGELLRQRYGVPLKAGPHIRVLDLMNAAEFIAPSGVKRRMENLRASARQIVGMWPSAEEQPAA